MVALTESGELWSCGSNNSGQLGQDVSTTKPGNTVQSVWLQTPIAESALHSLHIDPSEVVIHTNLNSIECIFQTYMCVLQMYVLHTNRTKL